MRRLLSERLLSVFALLALIGSGCGDDPVSFSAPVGINLKVKSGDAKGGVVSDEKGITTESGNPFGKFVADAQAKLGRAPARIELAQLQLTLGAKSKNVTALEQIFGGEVSALLLIDDTKNTVNAGKVTVPTGGGPTPMSIDFDWNALNETDRAKFLQGSFKVVLRGAAAAGFDKADAEADLQLTFSFAAFE